MKVRKKNHSQLVINARSMLFLHHREKDDCQRASLSLSRYMLTPRPSLLFQGLIKPARTFLLNDVIKGGSSMAYSDFIGIDLLSIDRANVLKLVTMHSFMCVHITNSQPYSSTRNSVPIKTHVYSFHNFSHPQRDFQDVALRCATQSSTNSDKLIIFSVLLSFRRGRKGLQ